MKAGQDDETGRGYLSEQNVFYSFDALYGRIESRDKHLFEAVVTRM